MLSPDLPDPEDQLPDPPHSPRPSFDDTVTLTAPDPSELLQELADLERQVRNAEDDIAATRATLKAQQERLTERLNALRQTVRAIEAPPLPLFALGEVGPDDGLDR